MTERELAKAEISNIIFSSAALNKYDCTPPSYRNHWILGRVNYWRKIIASRKKSRHFFGEKHHHVAEAVVLQELSITPCACQSSCTFLTFICSVISSSSLNTKRVAASNFQPQQFHKCILTNVSDTYWVHAENFFSPKHHIVLLIEYNYIIKPLILKKLKI